MGLVTEVAPREQSEDRAVRLGRTVAAKPRQTCARPRDQGPGAPGRPFAGRPRRRHRRRAGGHRRSPRRRGRLTAPRRRNSRSRGRVAPTTPCGPRATVSPPGGFVRFTGPTPHRPRDRWTRPAGRQAGDSRCPFTLLRSRTGTRPVAPCPSRTCRREGRGREVRHAHRLRRPLRADRRRGRDRGAARRRLARHGHARLRLDRARSPSTRCSTTPAPSRGASRAAHRRRPALRQLPGGPDAGAAHRDPLPQGGRRERGQARGRRPHPSTSTRRSSRPASPSWATSA